MLAEVVEVLICPHCGSRLGQHDARLACERGHSFDIARHGYANLLPGDARTGTADTAEMVAARARFLDRGWFAPVGDAVAEAAARVLTEVPEPLVVDAGAGTGYYLARVLDAVPAARGLALDISKHAARRAARAHERATSVVCDTWRGWPLRTAAAALVLDIFAPRNAEETARVLVPDGTLLVVTPADDHLAEAVAAFGLVSVDGDKSERLSSALRSRFERRSVRELCYGVPLGPVDLADLVEMGPSARHVSRADFERTLRGLPEPFETTISVLVAEYRRKS